MTRARRVKQMAAVGLAAIASSAAGAMVFAPGTSGASSHREAPLIAKDPQVDNTDVYAYTSPDKAGTVTLSANWLPFEYPAGGPNFYSFATDAYYDINISNDGGAKPNIIYRWTFKNHTRNGNTFLFNTGPVKHLTDKTLNDYQTYKLQIIRNGKSATLADNVPVAPSNVGKASMPDYATLRKEAVKSVNTGLFSGVKTFAGQASDSFFLDLRVFDLLYGANLKEVGHNSLKNFNVQNISIQVTKSQLAKDHDSNKNPIIGVWSSTERRSLKIDSKTGKQSPTGPYVQVSRLGAPLVNEVVVPQKLKDAFNFSKPTGDGAFLPLVQDPEVPRLIQAIYGIKAPATPRNDLVSVFLTGVKGLNQPANVTPSEMIRLNMLTPVTRKPNRLGVLGGDKQGFPNGRRLTDDVVDIELQALEGALVGSPNSLGDGVNQHSGPSFEKNFPFVGLPTAGSAVGGGTSG